MRNLTQELTALGSRRVFTMTSRLVAVWKELVFAAQEHFQARKEQAGSEILRDLWKRVEELRSESARLSADIERQINKELRSL